MSRYTGAGGDTALRRRAGELESWKPGEQGAGEQEPESGEKEQE